MTANRIRRTCLATALVLVGTAATPGSAGVKPLTYYSGASQAAPAEIATSYIRDAAGALGLDPVDVADLAVTDLVPTRHNGVTHVYLRQRLNGLEIDGAEMGIHIDRQGRIFHRTGSFVARVAERAAGAPGFPVLAPEEAIREAAQRLRLPGRNADLALVDSVGGFDRRTVFSSPALSEEPIPARLRYFRNPETDRLTLAWNFDIKRTDTPDWLDLWVDSASGEIVHQVNWTAEVDDASYGAFALPKESPSDGDRTLEVDPYLAGGTGNPGTGASPYGWLDTNGVLGPDTTMTIGNNVEACLDAVTPNGCDPGSSPSGTGNPLVFNPAIDLDTQQPADYRPAAIVNLFYWNNIIHDVSYRYGFDEPAGNFQLNNYGRGGAGNDSVRAEAQDYSGTNNANFSTPSDGSRPRMQMYVWTDPFSQLVTVNSPVGIAGSYTANASNNGGEGDGLTQDVVLVIDAVPPTDDACEALTNGAAVNGKIALIRWSGGLCNSSVFVQNAANAGAIAAIIIDTLPEPRTNFGGAAAIPSVAVGAADGQLIVDTLALPQVVNATLEDNPDHQINRDSDLDAGIIVHEYGHGISNRLTGGPAASGCLGNAEQMGEGWSDWQALFLTASASDTVTTPRPMATYVNFEDGATGNGIRHYPYSTELATNPLTYGDIPNETSPHGIGATWANMLFEMYWNIIGELGFDPDLYDGTGGNNRAYQLVTDGMKLQPCSPGFVDGRDAILAANEVDYDGDFYCAIWNAFAKRGVGVSASQGSNNIVGDEVEAFDVPAICTGLIFADSFGVGLDRWSSHNP